MSFPQIDTPAVLVDLDVVDANIAAFQNFCDDAGMKLRPHIKTHKLPFLARQQISAGAVGVTCQKVSEAEAMIAGDDNSALGDILITYNILGDAKLARLARLAAKAKVSVVADNAAVVDGLARAFADAAAPMRVLVECDTGADRCGVRDPDAAAVLAERVAAAPGLHFAGLMTYPPPGRVADVQEWLSEARRRCEARGLSVEVVSSGGSPDMWNLGEMNAVSEYRAGTYVYYDRSLHARGVCDWSDCALTVLTTVVSAPTETRAVIDAGSKVLTSDLLEMRGHGHVLARPDLEIDGLSEEHGRVTGAPTRLRVGDRLRIVPNHACVVANMLDRVELVRGDEAVDVAEVVARGQVW